MRYFSSRALVYWISSLAFDTKSTAFISPLLLRRAGFLQQGVTTQVLATSMSEPSNAFTSSRSIPKEETKILDLLQSQPTADGRGVKIAVLDTGCDLAAAGLQETSEGLPKYLDFLDCTGDGDIDTTATATIPEANETIVIKGKSGRELTIGEWAPKPGSEVRLGSIRLYDVIPRSVMRRLLRERKEVFVTDNRQLIAQTQQTLDELQTKIDSCAAAKADGDDDKDKIADEKKELILQRKDTETLLGQYQAMMDSYNDAGPYMDVVMFQDDNDGDDYKAVIDLKADGNLTESIPFSAFAKKRQMGEFGFGSAVTFCIQIYDEGKTLSIVTDAGSHGTHVAGIAAANFGADSIKNGVAPGAQVLACKIGDGRLGSTETGTGLIRALIAAKKYDCDLVNLSYGEPSWQPDSGRVSEVFTDAVKKWGITVFTSAGNDGPALSSLGSPGALSAPITVGAYVSSDMMVDQYSTLPAPTEGDGEESLRDASYYFSSRGPTPDGLFPDICAPGGAIAPIPRHALQGKAQYHGTSMSSPNACGVAACVLSAVKQRLGITHLSPPELRKGLLNTATPVEVSDPFAQGAGLVSATSAVDYILENRGKLGQDLTVDVSIPSRNSARGLYIRDALELKGPMTFDVKVKPEFLHASTRTAEEMDEVLSMELDLDLKPSKTWVKCPERMSLLSAIERDGQTFSIRLAVDDLLPGVHYATIDGIDSTDVARGPLFRLPVTVVKPHSAVVDANTPTSSLNEHETITVKENGVDFSMSYQLEAGAPNRRFLEVPSIAEWVTFKIKSTSPVPSETSPSRVLIHAIPFVRGDIPNTEIQLKRLIQVNEGYEKEFSMKVKGGSTLEVCLQLLWLANAASTSIIVDVEFHSFLTRSPTLVASQPVAISAGREFARLGAAANLRTEKLNPSASLDTVQRTIRPSSYNIISGSADRDIMPPSDAEMKASAASNGTEIYNMFLKYNFDIDSDKPIKVTPVATSLFNQLYDSPLDSQIWELRDGNSQLLECGSSMHHANSVSLKKGNYTITFHTRHPSRQVLEQMKDLPFQLLLSVDSLDCKVYSELDKASTPAVTGDGRSEVGLKVLRKGSFQDLYISRPTGDLPSWVKPGDLMTGKISLDKGKPGVTSMQLTYLVPPKSQVKKLIVNSLPKDEEEEKTLDETIFGSKVSYLSKIRSKDVEAYKELSEKLLGENSTSVRLLSELLLFAKEVKVEGDDSKELARVKEIQKVRDLLDKSNGGPIDESSLAQYYGVAAPSEDDLEADKEAAKLKKKMDEQKKLLKATLLALSDAAANLALADSSQSDVLDSSVKELKKWGSFSDAKDKLTYSMTISRHQRLCKGGKGEALKTLMDARKDASPEHDKQLMGEMLVILESLEGTQHIVGDTKNTLYKRFPPK
jgi:tripeptidyl-peptidase-2